MPDGTSRFSARGEKVHHYMGCSTFANFTVLPEIAVAKIREDAPFDKVCYIGCGVTTGIGAVINTAQIWQFSPLMTGASASHCRATST
jgi:S-(hydroxymethyl)glutathione dehydrogenase / alcohol dehydrogenase